MSTAAHKPVVYEILRPTTDTGRMAIDTSSFDVAGCKERTATIFLGVLYPLLFVLSFIGFWMAALESHPKETLLFSIIAVVVHLWIRDIRLYASQVPKKKPILDGVSRFIELPLVVLLPVTGALYNMDEPQATQAISAVANALMLFPSLMYAIQFTPELRVLCRLCRPKKSADPANTSLVGIASPSDQPEGDHSDM